jgi:hypothetical protein
MAEKKPMPQSVRLILAALTGAGLVTGGDKLAKDSPVHFAVEGEAPQKADGWVCAPEGGIIGAPMVCHLTAEKLEAIEFAAPDAGSEKMP